MKSISEWYMLSRRERFFPFLGCALAQILRQIVSLRVMTLSSSNLMTLRIPVDVPLFAWVCRTFSSVLGIPCCKSNEHRMMDKKTDLMYFLTISWNGCPIQVKLLSLDYPRPAFLVSVFLFHYLVGFKHSCPWTFIMLPLERLIAQTPITA